MMHIGSILIPDVELVFHGILPVQTVILGCQVIRAAHFLVLALSALFG